MQQVSGANKDAPVLHANHWGGGQSSVWRATRRIGLAARRRFSGHSSATLIGLDFRRLWNAPHMLHIENVAAEDAGAPATKGAPGADPTARGAALLRAVLADLVFPLLVVGATSLVLAVVAHYASFELHSTLYLIPVIVSAVRWGIRSAVVAALASVAVFDFFFLPPLYSFSIAEPSEVVDLAMFLVVALVTGNLAAALRREADRLRRRERDVHNLHLLSRRLALCSTESDLVAAVQDYLTSHLGCQAFLIQPHQESGEVAIDDPVISARLTAKAAEMVAAGDTRSRLLVDPELHNVWALKSIATKTADHGILGVNLGHHSARETGELNDRVEAILSEAAAALERIDAAAAFTNASLRLQSDFLKNALIGSVSHQLRSPIASILGSTSVLDGIPALRNDGRIRSLVDGMHREAKRLDGDIQNLLDTVRITDSGIKPVLEWADPADLVTAAIRQRSHRLDGHKLVIDIEEALPLLRLDSGLVEQALGQVIENAGKYSPTGSTVTITVKAEADEVIIAVADNGIGLLEDEAASMFKRAFRGRRELTTTPGLGLGLWIARIFIGANGGAIATYSPGPGEGTTVTVRFPVHADAAALTHVQIT
jgi:K+-sensing histidine kinase KdpD